MEMATLEEVTARLRSMPEVEPRFVVSGNLATPAVLLDALGVARERCRVFVLNAQSGWSDRSGFISETPFVGPGVRHDPALDYLPMRLSLVPRLFTSARPPDAVLIHTSLPHEGKVSLGIEVNVLPAAIEQAKVRGGLVIAQMNPHMPYTYGDGEVATDEIDMAIEVDEPLATLAPAQASDTSIQIAERIARFASDGTTLQLGIGQIPTVAAGNMSHLRQLRVWSEMLSDGILSLVRAGTLDTDQLVHASFLMGSRELYEWADKNTALRMLRTETVNNPTRISANPAMLSINAAMQVDLFAQANASFVAGKIHSGFGGQPDFVSGALHSAGGQAVVALHSWHDKTDASTVLPILNNPVTSFQHSAIVSEHGCAEVFGHSEHAQARLIIEQVADPRVRDQLTEASGLLGLLRDSD